jgi:hypothetical protein
MSLSVPTILSAFPPESHSTAFPRVQTQCQSPDFIFILIAAPQWRRPTVGPTATAPLACFAIVTGVRTPRLSVGQ